MSYCADEREPCFPLHWRMATCFDVLSYYDVVEIALKEIHSNRNRRKPRNNNKVTMNNDNNNSITL